MALVLSVSSWAILLAWLHGFGIKLSPLSATAILLIGWTAWGYFKRPWKRPGLPFTQSLHVHLSRATLWVVLAISLFAGVWALRDVVVGPGSDSYHHTLITQMIVEAGSLPDDYHPFAPIESFSYHFGFHAFAAAVVWLSGLESRIVVPLLAQFLMAASGLSIAFLAQVVTKSRTAATISAVIVVFVSLFPAYFINWGRYTQLTGILLLSIFLALIWDWIGSDLSFSSVPLLGTVAAGIAASHYKVAIMAATGVVVLAVFRIQGRGNQLAIWKTTIGRLFCSALLATLLLLPWFWHLLLVRKEGFPSHVPIPGPSFFTLERLGTMVLLYPTNFVLTILLVAAVVVGWWRRESFVMAATVWFALMITFSTPRIGNGLLDLISLLVSLYLPGAVAIGWFLVSMMSRLKSRRKQISILMTGLVGASICGFFAVTTLVDTEAVYVKPEDLPAMEWIRDNTPESARFMVNTFNWDFLPDFCIGSDAGYWLPLLARRATVTLPLIYPNERLSAPDSYRRLAKLHQLRGHLTTPEAIHLLQREKITHVYIGKRGGPISASELENSTSFKTVYARQGVYVFQLVAF